MWPAPGVPPAAAGSSVIGGPVPEVPHPSVGMQKQHSL